VWAPSTGINGRWCDDNDPGFGTNVSDGVEHLAKIGFVKWQGNCLTGVCLRDDGIICTQEDCDEFDFGSNATRDGSGQGGSQDLR
jgi:hypothetical protein